MTLDGSVHSPYEMKIAERDAKNVIGAAWVTNNLFVREAARGLGHRRPRPFQPEYGCRDGGIRPGRKRQQRHGHADGESAFVVSGVARLRRGLRVLGAKAVIDNITVAEDACDQRGELEEGRGPAESGQSQAAHELDDVVGPEQDQRHRQQRSGHAGRRPGHPGRSAQEAGDLALHTAGISEVDNRLTVQGFAYHWDEHRFR